MPAEGWVRLQRFYYPGWRAATSNSAIQLQVRPSIPEGLLEVKTGPGRHEIVLDLATSMAEWIGRGISGFSVVLFALFARRIFRHRDAVPAC
jgi:hypothetical protein